MKRTTRSISLLLVLMVILFSRLGGQVTGSQLRLTAELHTTTAYNVVPADCGKLLSFSAPSAISIAISPSTLSSITPGCWIDFHNIGASAATITSSGSTIDGLSSAPLDAGHSLHMVFTGNGFLTTRGGSQAGTWSINAAGSSDTPVFTATAKSGTTFSYTLTGDVSSSTLTDPAPGVYIFAISQDGTGDHKFAWPPNVTNAPPVDPGPNDTTYLLCQYDGTTCVGIGNFVVGSSVIPGVTIPGATSGSNTIAPPAVAGSASRTNLAPNGTTVIPNACVGQVVQSIAPNGVITCAPSGAGTVGPSGPAGSGTGGSSLTTDISIDLGPLASVNSYTSEILPVWSLEQGTEGHVNVPTVQIGSYITAAWQFSASNSSAIGRSIFIPSDADLDSDVTVTLVAAPDTSSGSGNFAWKAKLACTYTSLISWGWNAAASTGGYTVSPTQYMIQESTTAALPVTGCTPGALARIAVFRDHTITSDSLNAADLYAVKLNYSRK